MASSMRRRRHARNLGGGGPSEQAVAESTAPAHRHLVPPNAVEDPWGGARCGTRTPTQGPWGSNLGRLRPLPICVFVLGSFPLFRV